MYKYLHIFSNFTFSSALNILSVQKGPTDMWFFKQMPILLLASKKNATAELMNAILCLVPWITYMMIGNLKDNCSGQESLILLSNKKVKTFFVKSLSNLVLVLYVTNANMAVTLAQFLLFP